MLVGGYIVAMKEKFFLILSELSPENKSYYLTKARYHI